MATNQLPKESKKKLANARKHCIISSEAAVVATGDEASGDTDITNVRDTRKQSVILNDETVYSDKFYLLILRRETETRLDTLAARVREGVEVLAASDFARWLQFSGIFCLLKADGGDVLRTKCADLLFACGEWFRTHERANFQPEPVIPRTELERINGALASICDRLDKLAPSVEAAGPALRVMDGGSPT